MKRRLRTWKCSPGNSCMLSISRTFSVAFFRKLYNWKTEHSHMLHKTTRWHLAEGIPPTLSRTVL